MGRSRLNAVRHCALIAGTALLLASCGGGDEPAGRRIGIGFSSRTAPGLFPRRPDSGRRPPEGHVVAGLQLAADPVHAVLMPDGRVLSYGTNGDGTQTGYFIYDLWDGAGAPNAGHHDARQRHRHRHLLQLAAAAADRGNVLHRRRRQLDRHRHHQHRQQQQQRPRRRHQRADARAQHEPRALVLDARRR